MLNISYAEIVQGLSPSLNAGTLKRSIYYRVQNLERNVSIPLVLAETFIKGSAEDLAAKQLAGMTQTKRWLRLCKAFSDD